MPFSRITYTYSGQPSFAVNFTLGYISQDHVTCRINEEVDGSGDPAYRTLTWLTSSTVSIGGDALVNGDTIVFERTVPKDEVQHDYQNGAILEESNLDESFLQAIMLAHEVLDGRFGTFAEDVDLGNNTLINVADPVNAQDGATKNYIDTFEALNTTTILAARDKAEQWAEENEDTEVESGQYSAKHHAIKAAANAALLPTNNFTAVVAPTVSDDAGSGYSVGSRWVDTVSDESYICVDAANGAAVWVNSTLTSDELGPLSVLATVGSAPVVTPEFTDSLLLGDSSDSGTTKSFLLQALRDMIGGNVGDVVFSARTTPPSNGLLADGSAVSRTTYATLFADIGTTHGVGDGSTTFNLPDLVTNNRFIRAADGSTLNVGDTQTDLVGEHTHPLPFADANGADSSHIFSPNSAASLNRSTTTSASGGSETRPHNIALLPYVVYK